MLRDSRQYDSGTASGQRLLFGGMYGQKGYAKEQPVPVACGVHQIREFTCSPTRNASWRPETYDLRRTGKVDSYHMSITLSSPVSMSYAILITFVSCSCTFPELLLCAKS